MEPKLLLLSLFNLTTLVVSTQTAIAQQIPTASSYTPSNRTPVADSTLGTQVSGTGGNFEITGGVSKGQTLFHSFTDFSVPTSGQANFLNPVGNRDIITRVTGNLFSDINGLVNTNGANLFLINPNGIVFGTNAQLNVGKAFVGSTANSIDLVGGGQTIKFGTNPSGDAPLLSVAPNVLFDVSRLNLGGGNGSISNFGNLETKNPGQYIGLIGGDVKFNGGKITAPGAKAELGGLVAPGTVTLGLQREAEFPNNVVRGNVSLTNGASVDVTGAGGGDIAINARNVEMSANSTLFSGVRLGVGTPTTIAGDIKINATETIALNRAGIVNRVNTGAVGKGGNVEINTRNLSVINGAQVSASTFGRGDAGSVKITATENVSFDGGQGNLRSAAFSTVEQKGEGKGGSIDITTRNLSMTNGAGLSAATRGKGDAGNIKIIATENVSFDGRKDGTSSGARSVVSKGAEGKGGSIDITTRNLSVTNGALLSTSTIGKGDAGSIKITATENVSFDGRKDEFSSVALTTVEQGTAGKGGNIDINTRSLSVTNGAQLGASTFGKGDAGNIKITATENVSFDGSKDGFSSGAFSVVIGGGVGKGGGVAINTRNLSISNGAELNSGSVGQGTAGNIVLNANTLKLDRGQISSTSDSSTGGDVNIITKNYLLMRNKSIIATDSASTGADGNGGNITIKSPAIVATPGNNDITANATQGTGGQVKIDSQGLFGIQYRPKGQASSLSNDITASSTFGRDGSVSISTPGTDPGKDSTELPNVTTDASNQISQACGANTRENKLTVTGRGGLPPNASDPLTSDVIWQDARANSNQQNVTQEISTPAKLAPLAVGWVFDGKGKVTLVAANNQGQPTKTTVVCPIVRQ